MFRAISTSSISGHPASQRNASPYERLRTELLETLNDNPAKYGLSPQTIQDAHSSNKMSLNGFFQALSKNCRQDSNTIEDLKTLYAKVRAKKEGVRIDNPIYNNFIHVVNLGDPLWIQCARCLPLYEPNSKQAGSVVNQLEKHQQELLRDLNVIHSITNKVLHIKDASAKADYVHNWGGNLGYLSSRILNFNEGLLQSDPPSNVKDFYQNNVFVHRAPVQSSLTPTQITLTKDQQKLIQLNPGLFQQDGRGNYIIVPSEGKDNYNHLIFSENYKLPDSDSRYPKYVSINDYTSLDQKKLSSLSILDSTDRFVFCTESEGDSLEKGAKLSGNTKTVFIMNPANARTPGGGACDNQPHDAMEENICRNSDLLSSLAHKFSTRENKKPYLNTATQAIVSTNTYKFENRSGTNLNFLSIASPDLKKSDRHTGHHRKIIDNDYTDINSPNAKNYYKDLMKDYWTTALTATLMHTKSGTRPVLVATPPGDFLKTDGSTINLDYVRLAAQSLKEVIDSQESFQKVQIVFARQTTQTDIFKQVLQPSGHRTVDVS